MRYCTLCFHKPLSLLLFPLLQHLIHGVPRHELCVCQYSNGCSYRAFAPFTQIAHNALTPHALADLAHTVLESTERPLKGLEGQGFVEKEMVHPIEHDHTIYLWKGDFAWQGQ